MSRRVYASALTVALQLAACPSYSATLHVWTNSPSDGPGTNWDSAFHTIQAAVDASTDGDTVLVTNGFYDTGGALTPGYGLSNRVCVTNAIVLRSVNGPSGTLIVGRRHDTANRYGSNAVRCVFLDGGATLDGFTLTNGHTFGPGPADLFFDRAGAGVYLGNGEAVSNCIVIGNFSSYYGGGALCRDGGTIQDSRILNNWCDSDGGGLRSFVATLRGCIFSNNMAQSFGGGATCNSGVVEACTFIKNSATSSSDTYGGGLGASSGCRVSHSTFSRNSSLGIRGRGGGAYMSAGAKIDHCTFDHNSAAYGGGAYVYYDSMLYDSLLTANIAGRDGGGVRCHMGAIMNCTVSGNYATNVGGGVNFGAGTQDNCIVYFNAAGTAYNDIFQNPDYSSLVRCSCAPGLAGNGTITNAPMFLDPPSDNYRLRYGSPCIDSGTNLNQVSDLDGTPRPLDGDWDGTNRFDIGAYEYDPTTADSNHDGIPDWWCHGHGLDANDPGLAYLNPDSDPDPTGQEWLADTDPNDPSSYFRLASFGSGGVNIYFLCLPCSTARVYTVEWSGDLLGWSPVPGMTNLPGDASGLMSFSISNAAERAFFRAKVGMP